MPIFRFFYPAEIEVAVGIVEESLARGENAGYCFIFADGASGPLGFSAYGPIPCTESSWDLYWIVIDNHQRGQGLGTQLIAEVEKRVRERGGTRIYVETSSRDQYLPTRLFYEQNGYTREAELPDYYSPGDNKIIYIKSLFEQSA